jgi:glutamine amidotransferase
MLAIVDYEMGNVRSVQKSFEKVGIETVLTDDPEVILAADGVVLPGVGAFGDAMEILRRKQLVEVIREVAKRKIPLLGICLGLQLLFEYSVEKGRTEGLAIFKGGCKPIVTDLKVPHMGWNELIIKKEHPVLADVKEGDFTYFVHSYHVVPEDKDIILASTEYDGEKVAMVGDDSVVGIQFHPEKSSAVGLKILENFGRMVQA